MNKGVIDLGQFNMTGVIITLVATGVFLALGIIIVFQIGGC